MTIAGSGLVGFLAVGWFGLLLAAVNLLILQATFMGSVNGTPDKTAMGRAAQHVQVVAVIIHRWWAADQRGASAWLSQQPQLAQLSSLVCLSRGQERTVTTTRDEHFAALTRALQPGERCDQVEGATGEFGYEGTNPIPADGSWYCRRLRCPAGHPYWYHRLGSVGAGPDEHMVDRVELKCFGGESHLELYFDMYHVGPSSRIPKGLSIGTEAGLGSTSGRAVPFPEGLAEYDPAIG